MTYENPSRLANRGQRAHAQNVLGFEDSTLTNAEPLPEPPRYGTGMVRPFAKPAAAVADPNPANAASQQGGGGPSSSSQARSSGGPSNTCSPTPSVTAAHALPPSRGSALQATVNGIEMAKPPQRVAGYAALAEFIASDKVFCVFRRFESLSIRNLLYLQDEIVEIEQRLNILDATDLGSGNATDLYSLHSRRHDRNEERKAIVATLSEKLYHYQKRLKLHSECLRMEKARDMYVDSVANWVDGKKPVITEESHFLENRGDLASLGLKVEDYHVVEKWVERHLSLPFVTKKHQSRPLFGSEVRYYSSTTIRRVVRCVLTLICVMVLIGPLFALTYTRKKEARLALIACFSLIFAFAIALVTKSRNFEIFIAMATYAAVLVVFVGGNGAGS